MGRSAGGADAHRLTMESTRGAPREVAAALFDQSAPTVAWPFSMSRTMKGPAA